MTTEPEPRLENDLEGQEALRCPLCNTLTVITTWVAKNETHILHNEFNFKCFNRGWGRSTPEKNL